MNPERRVIPWLGKHVELHYASVRPGTPFASGQVVAYSDQPQVCVELANGEKTWWSASLVREVECTCLCHQPEVEA